MAKALSRFTITPAGEDYRLQIEDDGGETLELTATPEQLDLIADAIDEHLADDMDDLDEADGEAED